MAETARVADVPITIYLFTPWGLIWPEKVTRQAARNPRRHAPSPERFGNLGSGPLKDPSGSRIDAQGIRERT